MQSYDVVLQGLKSHAVTMFEVGKLSDESLDSFLTELEKIKVSATFMCPVCGGGEVRGGGK